MTAEISDSDKTILTGRVYPAIQNCANNRYKIIVGYFAVIGYVIFSSERLHIFVDSGAALGVAIIFTSFVIHNSINYWIHAAVQWEREKPHIERVGFQVPIIEVASSLIMLGMIWGGFYFILRYSLTV